MTTSNRVTLEDIEANIVNEHYFTGIDGAIGSGSVLPEKSSEALHLLTFCVLVLRNGFTVVGQSSCVDPANFNAEIGRNIARENAVTHIWPLMGYELKTRLSKEAT